MDDINKQKSLIDEIERIHPTLIDLVDDMADREQVIQELNEITARFSKVMSWVEHRCKEIERIEPLSRMMEENIEPVRTTNFEVEDQLKLRPKTGVDVTRITEEVNRVKVTGFIDLLFICYLDYFLPPCEKLRSCKAFFAKIEIFI